VREVRGVRGVREVDMDTLWSRTRVLLKTRHLWFAMVISPRSTCSRSLMRLRSIASRESWARQPARRSCRPNPPHLPPSISAAAAHLRRRGVRRARDRRTARSRYHFAVEQSSIARGEFLELTIIAILVFELIPLVSGLLK